MPYWHLRLELRPLAWAVLSDRTPVEPLVRALLPRLGHGGDQQHVLSAPRGWKRNVHRLSDFCDALPGDLVHVFEFRDPDWLAEETFAVLDEHGACLCIHDLVDRHPRRVTGPVAYVRFHGSGQRYGGRYPRAQLRRWADWMCEAASQSRHVFVYFNNDAEANAVRDAITLRELVRR